MSTTKVETVESVFQSHIAGINFLKAAAGRLAAVYARDKYAPSAVSTRIFSPSLMKGGTCTTNPVSVLAGLVTLEAVALFNPGSVSTTVKLHRLRQLDSNRLAVEELHLDLQIGDQVVDRVAQNFPGQVGLLEVGRCP